MDYHSNAPDREMNIDSLRNSLQDVARQLRPATRSPFIPLVKLANELGIEVELRFYSNNKTREAQSEINSSQSRVLVYRKAAANGVMQMAPESEYLLTPRERFSIAHELGHCLAFKNFSALPVSKKTDPQEYRRQEKCMDDFAQALLVPDWLAKLWLTTVSKEEPVSLNWLKTRAAAQCGVSSEVVAGALTRFEPSIGFLRTAEAVRLANDKRLFVVFYSSYGSGMELPNLHSFIDDEAFITKIDGVSGICWIDVCRLGKAKCEELNVAWKESKVSTFRRRKEFKSTVRLTGRGYWISIRSGHRCPDSTNKGEIQLTLFD